MPGIYDAIRKIICPMAKITENIINEDLKPILSMTHPPNNANIMLI